MTIAHDKLFTHTNEDPVTNRLLADLVGDPDCLTELEDLPTGAKIKLEIAALWNIYPGRRVRTMHQDGVEERVVATRYPDENGIEEWYRLIDDYSFGVKEDRAQSALVTIEQPDSTVQINIDENDVTKVSICAHDSGVWEEMNQEDATIILDEFFHRSLVAAEKHKDRSKEERTAADVSALKMMQERNPNMSNRTYEE